MWLCMGSSPRGRGKPVRIAFKAAPGRLIPARAGKTRRPPSPVRVFQAHPRAGGENLRRCFPFLHLSGSSPRGRGKRRHETFLEDIARLIPARAGKTSAPHRGAPAHTAHPRAGGENCETSSSVFCMPGSSPRGQGKRERLADRVPHGRLIPARAGKTAAGGQDARRSRAHPRAGGENIPAKFRPSQEQGSSPRGRGKQTRDEREPFFPRLIPARAGKTAASWLGQVAVSAHPRAGGKTRGAVNDALAPAAHPRAGGENLTPAGRLVIDGGSSPRGRGKPIRAMRSAASAGLIPAPAGKTSSRLPGPRRRSAHPRTGGENGHLSSKRAPRFGSSPHGRGKQTVQLAVGEARRLIPARAGKTPGPDRPRSLEWAHPRTGGENEIARAEDVNANGSSPHGRGKPVHGVR